MNLREIRNENLYDEFMDTFEAIFHLILCEECRTGHLLSVQRKAMQNGRFNCGKPARIPKHSETCKLEGCELCAEFLRHSDSDLTVQDICNRMIRFMEKHTGSATTLAVPINRSSFGPAELAANFKSVVVEETVPFARAEPETNQMKNRIKGYDALRCSVFSILHSACCQTCRLYINQGSVILRSGKLLCRKWVGLSNHLAECLEEDSSCANCEIAEHYSEKTLTAFQICNRLIRFVEIYAGVPPEKRLKAPPGRPFIPNTAASFKTVENVEPEEEKVEIPVKAEMPIQIVVEVPAWEKTDNAAKPDVPKLSALPKANGWLCTTLLIVLLVISLFFNLLALKFGIFDNSKAAEPL